MVGAEVGDTKIGEENEVTVTSKVTVTFQLITVQILQ